MSPFFEELLGRFRDLHQQIEDILQSLPDEALDWKPAGDMNSVSVIVTHLTGAERFLIGDGIMREPSNRNRDAEFQVKGLSKEDLINRVHEVEDYLKRSFETLKLSDLEAQRTHPRTGKEISVAFLILHALDHVSMHVGHLQMTAQLWQLAHSAA